MEVVVFSIVVVPAGFDFVVVRVVDVVFAGFVLAVVWAEAPMHKATTVSAQKNSFFIILFFFISQREGG